ncbi:MAG: C25 family cysteine peptidase [Anaerolineales bacterium]
MKIRRTVSLVVTLVTLVTLLLSPTLIDLISPLPAAAQEPTPLTPAAPDVEALTAGAELVSVAYTFPYPSVERGEPYDRVTIPGLHNAGAPGAPVLPFETARILLPAGTAVEKIEVVAAPATDLEGRYYLEPGQALRPISAAEREETPPDPAIYGSAEPFPGELYAEIAVQRLTGYTILLLRLYPVHYTPVTGVLSFYERLEVRVTTTSSGRGTSSDAGLRDAPGDETRVARLVDNPGALATYEDLDRGVRPSTASLVSSGDPYDYVLITGDGLSSAFQPLVDWKGAKGLRAALFTTGEIYANYSGTDDADRVRNFIIDAYDTWAATDHPLQYVALGGDDEIIPVRYLYAPGSGEDGDGGWLPSDLYYAGLDGDWDADGDGLYGESAADGGAGEEVDFLAEVYVGRIPVDTPAGASNAVAKILDYEQNPDAAYLDRALMLGNQLDDRTWGADGKDRVAELIPQYNVTALNQRDGTFNVPAVIDAINAGTHLVNYDGHGNWTCCPLSRPQVDRLANTDYFVFYNLGCYTAAFDQDVSGESEAVAEHYLFDAAGAFAYIGNTRYGWYVPGSTNGPGEVLDRLFFDTAINRNAPNLGKALQLAKESYFTGYAGHRWSILALALLGDPETPLVTGFLSPVADLTAPSGGETLRGSVDVVGVAAAGGAAGATFDHYRVEYGPGTDPESWTQIGAASYISVTQGTLVAGWDTTVVSDGDYTLRLTVDDGAGRVSEDRTVVTLDNLYLTAPVDGDFVRGGEIITVTGRAAGSDFVSYTLAYGRGADPTAWTEIGSATTPVTDGVLMLWDTGAITVAGDYTVRLTLHGAEHESVDTVTLYVDPAYQVGWPQSLSGRITAPSVAVGDIDGDGDLELVAAETYNVHAWHHDGRLVDGWPRSGSGFALSSPALADIDRDGDLEIIVGSRDNRVYAWHHDGTRVAGWPQNTGDDVDASPAVGDLDGDGLLEVVVGSNDGRVYVWHYDGTPLDGWPLDVGSAVAASPALGDLDGDGDLELVVGADDGTVHAWHHDGTTVTGWPVSRSGSANFSSPALGDIDDDGDLEVIIGGDQVYAWHHDGTSVDGWPQEADYAGYSSPVLADLDDDDVPEIIIGGHRAYAWQSDGKKARGWPVELDDDRTYSSPAVGDIDEDGDGVPEVLLGPSDYDDQLYAWHEDGDVCADWPKVVPTFAGSGSHQAHMASPLLTDLDRDGDLEVVLGIEEQVLVWDLPGAYTPRDIDWSMFRHDAWHTGLYGFLPPNLPPFVRDVQALPGYVTPGESVTITARVSDEDGVASVMAEVEGPDETVHATLTLHDDGAHGDGAAGDGTYGNSWTTPAAKLDYVVDLTVADALSQTHTHNNVATFSTRDIAYLRYVAHTLGYDSLNGDGTANPGEYVEFSVTLENIGLLSAPGVTATIATDDPCITYYSTGAASFGDIAPGVTGTSGSQAYSLYVSESCSHEHAVTFDLEMGDAGGHRWSDRFEMTVVDNVGPIVEGGEASPLRAVAGGPVTLQAWDVRDGSGIDSVTAVIESPDGSVVATVPLYDDGLHGDGAAGDGTYGNLWTTDSEERNYYVDFVAEDGLGNVEVYDNWARFTTQTFTQTSDVLFVPDSNRGETAWFQPYYTGALEALGYTYDVWDIHWKGLPDGDLLERYADGLVLWAMPSWGHFYSADVQDDLQDYLDAGGQLFVTGQNVAAGLNAYGRPLLGDYLHATYVQNNAGTLVLNGVSGDPVGDGFVLEISGGDGADNQGSPDEIATLDPAVPVLSYTSSSSGTAGLRVESDGYRVVFLAFGFEAVNSAADRATLMGRTLTWLQQTVPPAASFAPSGPGWTGQGIPFANTTVVTGPISYLWDFGDGMSSTLQSPSHIYSSAGEYAVVLTATNFVGSDVTTATLSVHEVPTVRVVAGSGEVTTESTASFAVVVEDAQNLGSFDVELAFDSSLLRVNSVTPGDLLGSTGRSTSPVDPVIDNAAGRVTFGSSSAGPQAGPAGSGTLAVLSYTTLVTPGVSALELQVVQLRDTAGQAQPVQGVSGSVTIEPGTRVFLPLVLRSP